MFLVLWGNELRRPLNCQALGDRLGNLLESPGNPQETTEEAPSAFGNSLESSGGAAWGSVGRPGELRRWAGLGRPLETHAGP